MVQLVLSLLHIYTHHPQHSTFLHKHTITQTNIHRQLPINTHIHTHPYTTTTSTQEGQESQQLLQQQSTNSEEHPPLISQYDIGLRQVFYWGRGWFLGSIHNTNNTVFLTARPHPASQSAGHGQLNCPCRFVGLHTLSPSLCFSTPLHSHTDKRHGDTSILC